jgi:membrane-associated phospholipid phosphatase
MRFSPARSPQTDHHTQAGNAILRAGLAEVTFRARHWPDLAEWKAWFLFLTIFYATFLPAYFLTPYLAGENAMVLAFNWEVAIPRIDVAAMPYLSIIPAFVLPLFLLPAPEVRGLGKGAAFCAGLAALIFILLPTRSGFAAAADDHGIFIAMIRLVDVESNLFPSLHVAYGTLIVLACARARSMLVQLALYVWLAAMAGSTVLVHQHHIADIAAGALLGLVAWLVCRPAKAPPQPGND